MAWPTTSISTTHLDNDADSPVLARPDLKQMADNVNDIAGSLLDEDDLVSNSSLAIATQQSIKAYCDKTLKRDMAIFDAVNDYGAVGDDSTDDLTALQAAVDAAEAAGGGVVVLPDLTYRVSSALIIDSPDVVLLGLGKGALIKTTNTSIDIIQLKSDCVIKNVSFASVSVPTNGDAIQIQDDAEVVLEDVEIYNTFNGILIFESSSVHINNLDISQLHGGSGMSITGGSGNIAKKVIMNGVRITQPYPVTLTSHSQFKTWASSTAFSEGDVVVSSGNIYQCSTAGTSGATTPSGKGSSNAADAFTTEISDGTAGWKYVGSSSLKQLRVNTYSEDISISDLIIDGGAHGLHIESTTGTAADVPTRVNVKNAYITGCYHENVTSTSGKDIVLEINSSHCWQGKGLNATGSNLDHLSVSGKIHDCFEEGIYLSGVSDARIQAAVGNNSQSGSASFSGIRVGPSSERFYIVNTTSGDITGGTNNQAHGVTIDEDASIDNYVIRDCILQDNVTGGLDDNTLSTTSSVGGNI